MVRMAKRVFIIQRNKPDPARVVKLFYILYDYFIYRHCEPPYLVGYGHIRHGVITLT